MVFNVSWTMHRGSDAPSGVTVTKRSDANNHNMNLIDNLGNRYDHISAGGAAATDVVLENEQSVIGWFVFPPAKPGATSFTFHDDDNSKTISGILLQNPVIISDELDLKWYPLALEYRVTVWKPSQTEDGGGSLIHIELQNCQIQEWKPSEIKGKYKNTVTIGEITYEIYGWVEANWSVREYLAVGGVKNLDSKIQPLFHVTLPFDKALQCANDASEVLATLRPLQP